LIFLIFRHKPILDLDYLIDLFQSDESRLDVAAMKESRPDLYCILTDHQTREPVIFDLKKTDVFQVMLATSDVPVIYHKKILINGRRYCDGSLSVKKIIARLFGKLLADGFEEIIVVINKAGLMKSPPVKVRVLEPSHMPLWGNADTNQKRLIATIEQG
jgi:predicted patatin/cPLA2 family phospholipase